MDEVVEQGKTDLYCLKVREDQPTGFSTVLDFGTVVESPEFLDGAGSHPSNLNPIHRMTVPPC